MESVEEFLVNFRNQQTSERSNARASASESMLDNLDSTLTKYRNRHVSIYARFIGIATR